MYATLASPRTGIYRMLSKTTLFFFGVAALLGVPHASLGAPKSKETADSIRQKCMAKVNEQVPADFPRWREHLLTHCIERGGKL